METIKEYAPFILGIILGFFLGYGYMSDVHHDIMVEKEAEYLDSVEKARQLERSWQTKAKQIEDDYQKALADIQQSNDDVINRLRNQLDSYSKRLSSCSATPNRIKDYSREARVSTEVKNLIDFSEQCARRADELIIQVNGLQQWYKETEQ